MNDQRLTKQTARRLIRGALGGWVYCQSQAIQRVEISESGRVVGYVRVVVPADASKRALDEWEQEVKR